jgi:hypothetical protein
MLRAALAALALLAFTGCAHAEEGGGDARAAEATARVIIAALAPAADGVRGQHWDALSTRVSRHMHWHLHGPDIELAPDAIVRRNGWIDGEGAQIDVSAHGPAERVSHLTFELHDLNTLTLLDALRAQGAEVSFQADWEESSDYVVSAPGRDSAMLTSTRICRPPESRAGPSCHIELTLAFDLP